MPEEGLNAMLNWSYVKYKFTLGIGCLGIAGGMAELWKPILPAWIVVVVAALPLALFIILTPDDMPDWLVTFAQVFASIWYILSVAVVSVGYFTAATLTKGWMIFPVFWAVGMIPCVIVIGQMWQGKHRLQTKDSEDRPAAP